MEYIVGYMSKMCPISKWSVIIYHSYAGENLNSYEKDNALDNKFLVQNTLYIIK
jgi:hypothetical protein